MRFFSLLLLFWLTSCDNSKQSEATGNNSVRELHRDVSEETDDDNNETKYGDGTWCAEVEYYNPNTGTQNSYDLNVEIEGGELVQINWPNGGWLDESHFIAEDITSGECSFISDKGYQYTVTLNEKGGCSFTDTYRMKRDMEEERQISTCPKCGNEKETYNDLCDNCQDKAEICPKCYGYKMEWEAICSGCQEEQEERRQKLEE
jgi:hypothetical protein